MGMRSMILSHRRITSGRGEAPPGTQLQPGLHPAGGVQPAGEGSRPLRERVVTAEVGHGVQRRAHVSQNDIR